MLNVHTLDPATTDTRNTGNIDIDLINGSKKERRNTSNRHLTHSHAYLMLYTTKLTYDNSEIKLQNNSLYKITN